MNLRPLAAALAAALPLAASAATALTVYSSASPGSLDPRSFQGGGAPVPGYAFVREDRELVLARGRNAVRITDVPALIDPTTLAFASLTDPDGTRVLAQSFEFDLTSPAKLLSRYLDREITVEQPRGTGVETFSGTLLSAQDGLVLRNADGSVRVVNGHTGVKLPSLPGGLISKPTLVWDLESAREGPQQARFSYQANGLTWWTDYNLVLSEDAGACKVDVGAWVSLVNQSGATYRDATLKLVAGDVQRAQPPRVQYAPQAVPMAAAREAKADGFTEKAFFEYHLYTLGRPVTLPDSSTQQLELFPRAASVGCEKRLVYAGQAPWYAPGGLYTDRGAATSPQRKVDVYLRLRNAKSNGLGVPLPAGRVRVAKLDPADRALEFVGEDLIGHTARDELVSVKLGSAFDVVGERKQADFRLDTAGKWMEEDIEVRVRNRKPDEAVKVVVRESMYRWSQWSVTQRTHEFTKDDARTIAFPVTIAPGAEAVVRYTARYTW